MDDVFTTLKIVGKEKTGGLLTDAITNMTAIFKAHAECQRPRTVLIEGDPGMGKTTFCQKLAYDWATKQDEWDPSFPEIEVLLLLKCHEIKSDIWKAIDEQILPEEMDDEAKEYFFKFIRENQSKILLVLDGLDEANTSNLKMFSNLIESKELSGCYIVLTSRHEAGRKVRRYCNTLWEIEGFTKEDAKSFICCYFEAINKEHLAEKLIDKIWPRDKYRPGLGLWSPVWALPKSTDLCGLTKNPLYTTLLCVICEYSEDVLPSSRTQLYTEIVLCILRQYERKQGLSSRDEDLLTVYKEDLIHLGRRALESLLKGEMFFEEHESSGSFIVLSKFGFLSLQATRNKTKTCVRYAFLHKSFQEFFSGFYLAHQLTEGHINCESLVTDKRYVGELKQTFLFMFEVLASTSRRTAESLVKCMALNINSTAHDCPYESKSFFLFVLDCLSEYASLGHPLGRHLNLITLDLKSNDISDAASLSHALGANSSLTLLNLSCNSIGDSGATSLSQALAVNSSLTRLKLSCNSIGDSGAASLSQALGVNSSLTHLDLFGNDICASGAVSLSKALATNATLTYLNLGENFIGDSGVASLSRALASNSSLTHLLLSMIGLSDTGVVSLSQALTVNSSLRYLNLRYANISASGAASLSQALAANSSLTRLDLHVRSLVFPAVVSLSQALEARPSLTIEGIKSRIHRETIPTELLGCSAVIQAQWLLKDCLPDKGQFDHIRFDEDVKNGGDDGDDNFFMEDRPHYITGK